MNALTTQLRIALLSACLCTACGDFLDEVPKSTVTSENYYKTREDAIAATDAIYDYLISGYAPGGLWDENFGGLFFNDFWELPELMSDNMTSKQSSVDFVSTSNFQIDAFNSRIRILWRDFYQTINACNTVIQKVPDIPMDEVLKNQLVAEARFFRALCYFELTRFFGDVPLHTTPVENVSAANIERTPTDQIYPVVLEDLAFAEANLSYADRLGFGRPFARSASALLARVYLTLGVKQSNTTYLTQAVEKADLVIPEFPLFTGPTGYADIFKLSNRFKGEHIWEVNFNATLSQGWKGNQFLVRLLPQMDTGKGGPANGQGYDAATAALYSAFDPMDARRDVTLFKSFTYSDNTTENFSDPYFCKYWDRVAEPNGNESDATYPYLRTAEMYLIKAEALNELNNGPNGEAKAALNAIRHRAGLGDTPAGNYADFKKAVLAERRLEFAGEGHRWHDLVRMCTLEELSTLVKAAKPNAQPKAANLLFPIPQRERDITNGKLTQNEGY